MTDETANDEILFEEALDLIIRLQSDPANPVARELASRWRARGPRYEAAWAEAVEIHGMAGKVLEDRRKAGQGRQGLSRRTVILGSAAGLMAAGAGAVLGPGLLLHARADHVTSTGELRRIDLPDGTIVTLGPDSAIRSSFSPSARRVELLAGMAFFEVSPDPARPFQATAEDLTATALGTAFDLSIDAGFLSVAVDHGRVRVEQPGSALAHGETLSRGNWLTFDGRTRGITQGRREASEIGAWRDGMVVADGEPIAAVVSRVARWKSGRVMLLDSGLGAQRISGVFDVRNPIAALQAVVHPYGGSVRQVSPWLTLVSPV